MALNIKNEEVHRLAAKLAAKRGVSMSELVLELLQEEEQRETGKNEALVQRIMEIGRECARHLPPDFDPHKAMDDLYDDLGLPR